MTRAPALAFLFAGCCLAADLPKGTIIDRVICEGNAQQSYALYLPSNYSPDRAWPILYCFDPLARGRIPVDRYREAAEKFGYLLVGSNNSRNGPPQPQLDAVNAVWADTHARFSIDPRRTYVTGMSGGARLASSMAHYTKQFRGVIISAAGLSESVKAADLTVPLFGTIGNEDANYYELRSVDRDLDAGRARHRFVIFDGGHDWPRPSVAVEAVEWLQLQAMREGSLPRDAAFLSGVLQRRAARAAALEASNDLVAAHYEYASMAADFDSLLPITEFAAKAAQLARSRQVKQLPSREEAESYSQMRKVREVFELADSSDFVAIGSEVERLRLQGSGKDPDGPLARRILADLRLRASIEGRDLFNSGQYAKSATRLQLDALVSRRPLSWYSAGCAWSRSGNRKRANQAFHSAFENGLGYFVLLASCRK